MTNATYNITDDRLKVHFDDRLSDEEYQNIKKLGFAWWPGRKLFAALWTPEREDFLLGLGVDIEERDEPDDVEGRVERFEKLAASAELASERSAEYLSTNADTERRREGAARSIENNAALAEHWRRRIIGAVTHAAMKERPDVIARRIEKLEKEGRKVEKESARLVNLLKLWRDAGLTHEKALAICNYADHTSHCFTREKYPKSTYEGPRSLWSALTDGVVSYTEAGDLATMAHDLTLTRALRWADHIDMRLTYEWASYDASGGLVADSVMIQKGGAVVSRWGVGYVEKVNKKTVSVYVADCSWCHYRNIPRDEITQVIAPDAVDAKYRPMEPGGA
jgi:hypothetical protein